MINQVTLFLENKKGRLASALNVLAQANVNLYTFTIAETNDYGIVRLIVDDSNKAVKELKNKKFQAHLTSVIVAEIKNKTGATVNLLNLLENHNINIEYCYGFSTSDKISYVILRTVSPGAEEFIEYLGYNTISREDFYN